VSFTASTHMYRVRVYNVVIEIVFCLVSREYRAYELLRIQSEGCPEQLVDCSGGLYPFYRNDDSELFICDRMNCADE